MIAEAKRACSLTNSRGCLCVRRKVRRRFGPYAIVSEPMSRACFSVKEVGTLARARAMRLRKRRVSCRNIERCFFTTRSMSLNNKSSTWCWRPYLSTWSKLVKTPPIKIVKLSNCDATNKNKYKINRRRKWSKRKQCTKKTKYFLHTILKTKINKIKSVKPKFR